MASDINGHFRVRVGKFGEREVTVLLTDGNTVQDALNAAGYSVPSGYALRLNGNNCDTSEKVRSGDMVAIAPQSKGGV